MNEMRKLMEVVEQIEESEKTVKDIMGYFNGSGGDIKDGYIAKFAGDQGDEWVTNIHMVNDIGNAPHKVYAINRTHVGESGLLNNVRIYRLQKVL